MKKGIRVSSEDRAPVKHVYPDHDSAFESGYKAFRDADNVKFIITDERFVDMDGSAWSATYPTFPITPLADTGEYLIVV